MHLLNLAFLIALRKRTDEPNVQEIALKLLTGIAGIAAERIHRALGVDALETLRLHPLLNPTAYVVSSMSGESLTVAASPAHQDGGWITLDRKSTRLNSSH